VFNGSPLFTGDACSGESNFRKYLIENDLLDAIVAMPTELFYNTGIATYVWIVRNKKETRRKGKVQLINAVEFCSKIKKSLGNKRNEITQEHIRQIAEIYQSFKQGEHCKIFDNKEFGYTRVSLELSEIDENGRSVMEKVVKSVKGKETEIEREKIIKDEEYVPLKQDITAYLKKEVEKPYKILEKDIGYEISFTQYFYKYKPLRSTEDIAKEITAAEKESQKLMRDLGLMK
jgi:type I restriction enzyme M protein